MPRRINDEFSDVAMSKELKRRARKRKAGLCIMPRCKRKAEGVRCEQCAAIFNRARVEKRRALKRGASAA